MRLGFAASVAQVRATKEDQVVQSFSLSHTRHALDDASSAFVGIVPAVHVCYACKSFGAQSMLFVVVLFVSAFGSCIFDMLRVCR